MPLDPYLAGKLHLLEGRAGQSFGDPDFVEALRAFAEDPAPWAPPDVEMIDELIDGPHGTIPVRIYSPPNPARSALVWLHGGGFLGGDLDMPEGHVVAAELAARSGSVVVSVGYRLAQGGVRYPVPIDDVQAAWQWAVATYGEAASVALGGASAGAALALSAAIRERDAGRRGPDQLLLAYPFAHFPTPALDDALHAELGALPGPLRFTVEGVEHMVRNYVGRITGLPPDAMPGAAELGGLPPTRVLISEYDHLRGSAELLLRQLTESGVATAAYLAAGMPHGHLNRTPSLVEVDRSLAFFADGLRASE